MKRFKSGFSNAAADKIWCDHLGNNAFVWHRDQCPTCLEAYKVAVPGQHAAWCSEGDRILSEVVEEVLAQIDEVRRNQN